MYFSLTMCVPRIYSHQRYFVIICAKHIIYANNVQYKNTHVHIYCSSARICPVTDQKIGNESYDSMRMYYETVKKRIMEFAYIVELIRLTIFVLMELRLIPLNFSKALFHICLEYILYIL